MDRRSRRLGTGFLLFYIGCFLTGMGWPFHAAWAIVLALLILCTVLLRPQKQYAASGVVMVASLAVLVAMAALLAGAGGGMAILTGPVPAPLGPVLGLIGIALARLAAGSPERTAELDALLDNAIRSIETATAEAAVLDTPEEPTLEALSANERAEVLDLLAKVDSLPPGDPAVLRELTTLSDRSSDAALQELMTAPDDPRCVVAAGLLVLQPQILERGFMHADGIEALDRALAISPETAGPVAHMALESREPDLWRKLPDAGRLRALAADWPESDDRRSVLRLAEAVARAAQDDADTE